MGIDNYVAQLPDPCAQIETSRNRSSLAEAQLLRQQLEESQEMQRLAEEGLEAAHRARSAVPPDHLLCPITLDLFDDPVISPWGHTFERRTIEREISRTGTCPLTKR